MFEREGLYLPQNVKELALFAKVGISALALLPFFSFSGIRLIQH